MESQFVKVAIAFVGIMIVGFVIVGTTRETQQEKVQGAFLQTSSMLSNLALSKCSDAVKEAVGAHPYNPSESNSDHMTYVTLVWTNVGSAKRAECRYVMDQGVTLLRLDDRTLIAKEAPQVSGGGAPKPVHHQ
ncbi:MAG: hypothetical protein FIA97_06010 [Methylococcaceae bacterium]|nr:hypothetical protein [Methylococcaceae bacterium]